MLLDLWVATDVKLVDCEDLGYKTTDEPFPRGEVAARSEEMTYGYYKNNDANKCSFTAGIYLHHTFMSNSSAQTDTF